MKRVTKIALIIYLIGLITLVITSIMTAVIYGKTIYIIYKDVEDLTQTVNLGASLSILFTIFTILWLFGGLLALNLIDNITEDEK